MSKYYQFLVILMAFSLYTKQILVTATYSLPSAQKEALNDLYISTNGPYWRWKTPEILYGSVWNFSVPNYNPCSGWQGIVCSTNCKYSPCTITSLNLQGYGLQGKLPSTLSSLTSLTTFVLTNNLLLTGEIPSQFQSLTQLTTFSLANNNISGEIPASVFSNMKQLQYLYLDENGLHGTIPHSLGNLPKLESLFLHSNQLHGTIPSTFGNLTNLRALNLSTNLLTGTIPSQLGHCIHLQFLYMETTLVHGPIPETFGQLKNLSELLLVSNSLSGPLPNALSSITALRNFQIAQNAITGTISSLIFLLPTLEIFEVDGNRMTGTVPSSMGLAKKMNSFVLTDNYFNGSLPQNLEYLSNMIIFKVDNTYLSGSIPSSMQTWTSLAAFYVQTTFMGGNLPSWIGNWREVTQFIIFDAQFSGSLPASIAEFTKIQKLYLYKNRLNGSLPSQWNTLQSLIQLEIQENDFTGTLPQELCSLVSLRSFFINNNRFNGSIPSCINQLGHLNTIQFNNNLLSGSIPRTIGSLSKLEIVNLHNNRLTHNIPPNITSLPFLLVFNVFDNFLTGEIPSKINELLYLDELFLDNNLLTGTLPEFLSPRMAEVSLRGNSFHGTLPRSWWPTVTLLLDVSLNELDGDLTGVFNGSLLPPRIYLSNNQFRGHLLGAVDNTSVNVGYPQVEFFNATLNYLSGTLSPMFAKFDAMTEVLFASNYMSGTIPADVFHNMHNLSTLEFNTNVMTGKLPEVLVNSSTKYVILNLHSNAFTGTLPATMFEIGNLQSMVLSLNCFSGIIPTSICSNNDLIELLMDGLHASPQCVHKTIAGLSLQLALFQSGSQVSGSIPSCLWNMPSLQSLYISGNALQGSISLPTRTITKTIVEPILPSINNDASFKVYNVTTSVATLSKFLMNLDISHNRLTGTIPRLMWTRNFTTFDLSFNRLSGTVPNSVSSVYTRNNASVISLQVNRLSGSIPDALITASNINMLEGNLFGCDFNHRSHSLPWHDPLYTSYQCGSDYTNIATVCFATILSLLCIMLCIHYIFYERPSSAEVVDVKLDNSPTGADANNHHKSDRSPRVVLAPVPLWQRYQDYIAVYTDTQALPERARLLSQVVYAGLVLLRWQYWLVAVAVYVVVLGLPMYVLLSTYYGSYDQQYIWTGSATFLSGTVPAVILLMYLLGLMALLQHIDPLRQPAISVPHLLIQHKPAVSTSFSADIPTLNGRSDDGTNQQNNNSESKMDDNKAAAVRSDTMNNTAYSSGRQPQSPFSETTGESRNKEKISVPSKKNQSIHWPTLLLNILFVLANIVVVVSVNAAYIVAINQHYNGTALFFVSIAISLFKILWGAVLTFFYQQVVWLVSDNDASNAISNNSMSNRDSDTDNSDSNHNNRKSGNTKSSTVEYTSTLIALTIFNNIVAPYLADMVISPDCFKYALQTPPAVTSTATGVPCYYIYQTVYEYAADVEISTSQTFLTCQNTVPSSANETILFSFDISTNIRYVPSFVYNYQCSSSVIVSFAYIFIIRYTIGSLLLPFLQLILKHLIQKHVLQHDRVQDRVRTHRITSKYSADENEAKSKSDADVNAVEEKILSVPDKWYGWCASLLPPLMALEYCPLPTHHDTSSSSSVLKSTSSAHPHNDNSSLDRAHSTPIANSTNPMHSNNDLEEDWRTYTSSVDIHPHYIPPPTATNTQNNNNSNNKISIGYNYMSAKDRRRLLSLQLRILRWNRQQCAQWLATTTNITYAANTIVNTARTNTGTGLVHRIAPSLRVSIARDAAVLLTFGVFFPPLFVVVLCALFVQMQRQLLLIARLFRLYEECRALRHSLSSIDNPQNTINNRDSNDHQLDNNDDKIDHNSRNLDLDNEGHTNNSGDDSQFVSTTTVIHNAIQSKSATTGDNNAAELLSELVNYEQSLVQLLREISASFVGFETRLSEGLWLAVCVAAVFWSLSLFDILADNTSYNSNNHANNDNVNDNSNSNNSTNKSDGNSVKTAIWIVVVMSLAPAWLHALSVCYTAVYSRLVHRYHSYSRNTTGRNGIGSNSSNTDYDNSHGQDIEMRPTDVSARQYSTNTTNRVDANSVRAVSRN